MSDIYVSDGVYISTASACVVDLTPPSFSGINFIDVESRGQIRVKWPVATDPTAPIRYEVYIQATTATGLFNTTNIIAITDKLQYDIFNLPDGSLLQNGTVYHVGIRAIDGVNNRDSNTVSLNVISTGVLTSIDIYETHGTFTIGVGGYLQGTMWITKNSELGLGPTVGTASYTVYDKTGTAVPGHTQSGIVADSNGQFKITPILSSLDETLNHYMIKVSILMDSEVRNNYVSIVEKQPSFIINGHQSFDTNSDFIGLFWAEDSTKMIITNPSRLGLGSYDVLDKNGNIIPSFSESNISPNAQGVYVITPVPGVDPNDLLLNTGRVTIVVDGQARTTYIPVNISKPVHRILATFSINALNQFQATFWVSNDDAHILTTNLGTANYAVYDASGNAVAGLTQSGISADVNGRFQITPTSATLLTDLTHYNVKIGIIVENIEHVAYKGFTLLGN